MENGWLDRLNEDMRKGDGEWKGDFIDFLSKYPTPRGKKRTETGIAQYAAEIRAYIYHYIGDYPLKVDYLLNNVDMYYDPRNTGGKSVKSRLRNAYKEFYTRKYIK